ncbi:MAG: GerMN domain-containing protein [Bacilli bacterium]|nr:GerMN domain-containing protein [Bacilli bacterium]
MLKKISIRKLLMAFAALFAMGLIYLLPDRDYKLYPDEELEYTSSDNKVSAFLMDKDMYVSLTEVSVSENSTLKKAQELIKVLTIGKGDSKLPNGFSAIIPPDTEVLSMDIDRDVLKVDFSKELLDVEESLEEKMIESIVYTLTSIDGVDKIIIYVEGDILTKLPKTKINLPSTLDKSFGINKEFNLTSTKDITDVTVYFINQINDNYYYVPVTKYLNDSRDKISIIVEELSIGFNPSSNLMSFMSDDAKLVSSVLDENTFKLELEKNSSLDDVRDYIDKTLSLSICANYEVENVKINEEDRKCQ